jgi:hypothetical protein
VAKTTKLKAGETKIDASVTDAVELSGSSEDGRTETEPKAVVIDERVDNSVGSDIAEDDHDTPEDEGGLDLESAPDDGLEVGGVDDAFTEPAEEAHIDPTEAPDMDGSVLPATQGERTSSGGFIPLLIGGVVAGVIGYGVATYYPLSDGTGDMGVQLAVQADQIAALEMLIANIPAPDLASVDAQFLELSDQTAAQLDELSDRLSTQITDFDDRLAVVEKAPDADGTLSDTALAAYQREFDQLRAELTAQQEDVMSVAAQAESNLAAAREEAAQLEQEAIATAQAASVRAALNRVAMAVETGAPFDDALSDIGATDLPVALTDAAESGVATTAQLTEDFPVAARSALATARAEGVSDDAGGIGGFLRSQFDVRSTAPQEGAGPDAVLSRAEAAIKAGRVADALAELEALPEVARAEMTDWTARATQRADVLDAIATLSETYN